MKRKSRNTYRKRRRNPADIIQFPGRFLTPDEREAEDLERKKVAKCVDAMSWQLGEVWDEDDQEIAEKQFCPIEIHVDEIQYRLSRSSISTSDAITGLTESVFRLGRIQGQIMEHEVANQKYWIAHILDLFRDITRTLVNLHE